LSQRVRILDLLQAKGLIHTSPGQRPGFIVQQILCCRPRRAIRLLFLARRLWRLFHRLEPVGGIGALHRPPGATSSHPDIPRRVSNLVTEIPCGVRWKIRLGLTPSGWLAAG